MEQDPAVRELRLRIGPFDLERDTALELAIAVTGNETAPVFIPCALERAPPYRPAALDVEEIREVGLDAHLETHRDRSAAVVVRS